MEEIKRRSTMFRGIRPGISLSGRIVIITDDGVATGATMHSALRLARKQQPRQLICALPVGPMDSLTALARDCDELICLRCPAFFDAVGRFYEFFDQTTDEEVAGILSRLADRTVSNGTTKR